VAAPTEGRGEVPYLVPDHPSEVDRLDLQHYAFREAVGTNRLAPLVAPARILDVGSGTGQWGFEMCAEYPRALVVGLDLAACKPGAPAGHRCVRANLLDGLPFGDGRFDYVHQRMLFLAVPVRAWPSLARELLRVTRPGGWIELVETPFMGFDNAGPALGRLRELAVRAAAPRGLDTTGAVFRGLDHYLRDAGVVDVRRREFALPVGSWGGRVGSLMATDCRSGFTRFLEAMDTLDAGERHDLLQRVQEEYEERRVTSTVAVAFGRRPGAG
jgi:SAM-dependent methyltransferase